MNDSKSQLRQRGIDARRDLGERKRARFSQSICESFLSSHFFLSCENIACYLPFGHEVDTNLIVERAWQMKKSVFVPVIEPARKMRFLQITRNTRIERNHFGIWEPISGTTISPRKLDVVVTPLVAFDENRNRIGMGGGYFDRCFAFLRHRQHWHQPKLIGVAFDCQNVEEICTNPWDIRLYRVFTES